MSAAEFSLPDSMRPLPDLRPLAVELTSACFLRHVSLGLIPDAAIEEMGRSLPPTSAYTAEESRQMVSGILRWIFTSEESGLVVWAQDSRPLLQKTAAKLGNLSGISIEDVNALSRELRERHTYARELYELSRDPEVGDLDKLHEEEALMAAFRIVEDLVEPDGWTKEWLTARASGNRWLYLDTEAIP